VADAAELNELDPAESDGIGLVRTELLFHGRERLPDEEEQFASYRRLLESAGRRPVTIRTLDAGGDKPIPGLTRSGESNPFLGVLGVRLSLRRPDVFRVQLRALARAATAGNLKVMIPMVTTAHEKRRCRALLNGRRGVAGTLIVEKIVGAAAEEGRDLETLKAIGESVNARRRSIGVALSSCTVPAAGKPTFEIGEDEMELMSASMASPADAESS
jgi:hypothetical protein